MNLVIVLRFLVRENHIERNLVALIDHWTMARDHFPDMEMQNPRNTFEILVCTGNQVIRSFRIARVNPENDNVRKHTFSYLDFGNPADGNSAWKANHAQSLARSRLR